MLAELQEAAQQGAKAKIHRLARNGRGVQGRRYTHVAASSPSLEGARSGLESPAAEGGMSAKNLPDFDSEGRKEGSGMFRPPHLKGYNAHSKKKTKKVMPRVECTSGVVHHGFGSTVLCCGGLDSTWAWL